MILLGYCTDLKAIISESVDLKGVVNEKKETSFESAKLHTDS